MNRLAWTGLFVAWSVVSTLQLWANDIQPRIINGIPTTDFPAVGIVGTLNTTGFCTGTLIGPRHVLTAAHCAEAMLALDSEQSGFFQLEDDVYATSRIIIHPDYRPSTLANDIAILELAEPVTDIDPMVFSVVPPAVGESVLIVGFGGQGTPEDGSDGSFGQKLVGVTTIDLVRTTDLVWAFDEPSESNPAPGDSGGPVLVESAAGDFIVGIVSGGTTTDAGLGDTTFSTRVDAFVAWILDVVSEDPADEDPADAPDAEPGENDVTDDPADTRPASCHRDRWRRRPSGVYHRRPSRAQRSPGTRHSTQRHDTQRHDTQRRTVRSRRS